MTIESKRIYSRERTRRLKAERIPQAIEILGGRCVVCGATERLQFHHINKEEKLFNISKGLMHPYDIFLEEVLKCQLLCISCHARETRPKKELVHGTWSGYCTHNCRCDECRAAGSDYIKETFRRRIEKRKNINVKKVTIAIY